MPKPTRPRLALLKTFLNDLLGTDWRLRTASMTIAAARVCPARCATDDSIPAPEVSRRATIRPWRYAVSLAAEYLRSFQRPVGTSWDAGVCSSIMVTHQAARYDTPRLEAG